MAPQLGVDIALELKSTTNSLKDRRRLETLEGQQQIWQQRQLQLTDWLNVLTRRATRLQVTLTQLQKTKRRGPEPAMLRSLQRRHLRSQQQIDATLTAIEAAQKPHQAERDEILNV